MGQFHFLILWHSVHGYRRSWVLFWELFFLTNGTCILGQILKKKETTEMSQQNQQCYKAIKVQYSIQIIDSWTRNINDILAGCYRYHKNKVYIMWISHFKSMKKLTKAITLRSFRRIGVLMNSFLYRFIMLCNICKPKSKMARSAKVCYNFSLRVSQ